MQVFEIGSRRFLLPITSSLKLEKSGSALSSSRANLSASVPPRDLNMVVVAWVHEVVLLACGSARFGTTNVESKGAEGGRKNGRVAARRGLNGTVEWIASTLLLFGLARMEGGVTRPAAHLAIQKASEIAGAKACWIISLDRRASGLWEPRKVWPMATRRRIPSWVEPPNPVSSYAWNSCCSTSAIGKARGTTGCVACWVASIAPGSRDLGSSRLVRYWLLASSWKKLEEWSPGLDKRWFQAIWSLYSTKPSAPKLVLPFLCSGSWRVTDGALPARTNVTSVPLNQKPQTLRPGSGDCSRVKRAHTTDGSSALLPSATTRAADPAGVKISALP